MGYHAIAVVEEKQQLRIPVVGRQRPAVAEDNGLTFAPIFVKDFDAVFGFDEHDTRLSAIVRSPNVRTRQPDYIGACGATVTKLRAYRSSSGPSRSRDRSKRSISRNN